MLKPLPAIEGADAVAGGGRSATHLASISLDTQLDEATRALDLAKHELATALVNNGHHEELVAIARRHIEELRWMNGGATQNPELMKQAAAQAVTTLYASMDSALQARSETSVDIGALQARIAKQYSRLNALEEKRRSMSVDPGARVAERAREQNAEQQRVEEAAARDDANAAHERSPASSARVRDAAAAALTDAMMARELAASERDKAAATIQEARNTAQPLV